MNRVNIEFCRDFFIDFYIKLPETVQEKVDYVLKFLSEQQTTPKKFFEKLKNAGGLYEIKVTVGKNPYRIFGFFKDADYEQGGSELVLLNGFLKKDDKKDYKREIPLAIGNMEQCKNNKEDS